MIRKNYYGRKKKNYNNSASDNSDNHYKTYNNLIDQARTEQDSHKKIHLLQRAEHFYKKSKNIID
jgi:hypothetical protein